MSTRTTVTLDDDVLKRVKQESRSTGVSFRDTLNNLLRAGLLELENRPKHRTITIRPVPMGYNRGLNFDDVALLLEYGEGERHR